MCPVLLSQRICPSGSTTRKSVANADRCDGILERLPDPGRIFLVDELQAAAGRAVERFQRPAKERCEVLGPGDASCFQVDLPIRHFRGCQGEARAVLREPQGELVALALADVGDHREHSGDLTVRPTQRRQANPAPGLVAVELPPDVRHLHRLAGKRLPERLLQSLPVGVGENIHHLLADRGIRFDPRQVLMERIERDDVELSIENCCSVPHVVDDLLIEPTGFPEGVFSTLAIRDVP
jgi:hypothetical protein